LASSDLANWTPISTNAALTGNLVFTDTTAANYSVRYYRAVLPQSTAILERNGSGGANVKVELGKKGAQSFRHVTAGGPTYTISKIVLHLSRQTEAPDGNLIFNVGTGINTDALAGSSVTIDPSSITNTSGGNSFQRYEIVYDTPVGPLVTGTTYYLNLECEAGNGKPIYCESDRSDSYPNGTYYKGGNDDQQDLRFQIWGQ